MLERLLFEPRSFVLLACPQCQFDPTSKASVSFQYNYLVVLLFSVTSHNMCLLTLLTGRGTPLTAGLQQLSTGVKNEGKAIIAIRESSMVTAKTDS